jgi:hydrogenase expression/formation protein HypD
MELREDFEWRGLGALPRSALRIREGLAAFDAERLFALPGRRIEDPKACSCGQVLTGRAKPWECRVFGTACTPERPFGTCMVSSEGACAAFFSYGRLRQPRRDEPVRA